MSIICPSCNVSLNQITNSHIRAKHPEFKSVTEFKEFFKLESLWSQEVTAGFVNTMTGKTRSPYNLTEKYYEGVKRATQKRTGENHWNYGNHWNTEQKDNISNGVKNSEKFQIATARWAEPEYREYRIEILYSQVIPQNLKIRIEKGLIAPLVAKSDWQKYSAAVKGFTQYSLKYYRDRIDPDNLLKQTNYQLDHKFSKFEGFKQGIDAKIIGSVVNLTPLLSHENRKKSSNCSITKEDLIFKYLEFLSSNKPTP